MGTTDRIVGDLERRALAAAFLGELLRLLFGGTLVLGTVALVLRAALELAVADAALVLTPLGLLPGLAVWRAWCRRPSRAHLVGWLDAQAGGDGTLVTAHELPDERWSERADRRADRVRLPALDVGPEAWRLLASTAFVLICLLVPLQRAQTPGPPVSLFDATIARLGERLDLLRGLGMDEELAQELGGRLETIAEEVAGGNPEAGFEALDRLGERLGGEGARLAENLTSLGSSLAAQTDPEALGELLGQALTKLEGSPLLDELPEELRSLVQAGQAMQAAGPSPTKMLEMSAGLRELLGSRLLDLKDAGFLDPSRLESALEAMRAAVVEHECDEECEPGGT